MGISKLGELKNDYGNETSDRSKAICLLEKHLARWRVSKLKIIKISVVGN
jgi:hypothetical protein